MNLFLTLLSAANSHGHASEWRLFAGLGLVVLLAILAGSRFLWRIRRYPLAAQWISGGWLAVVIGILIGPHGFNFISHEHVLTLKPVMLFFLGWIGLMLGIQLHRKIFTAIDPSVWKIVWVDALVSFGLTTLILVIVVMSFWDMDRMGCYVLIGEIAFAGIMGCVMMGWSPETRSTMPRHLVTEGTLPQRMLARYRKMLVQRVSGRLKLISGLSASCSIILYGLIMKLSSLPGHHEIYAHWIIAGVISVCMTILIGVMMAYLGHLLMPLTVNDRARILVLVIGLIAFSSGAASALGLSVLLVTFVCGVVLVNLESKRQLRFTRLINGVEQPMGMALMLMAGILASFPWGLPMLLMVGMMLLIRFFAKRGVLRLFLQREEPDYPNLLISWVPLRPGAFAVALLVGLTLIHDESLSLLGMDGASLLGVILFTGFLAEALITLKSVIIHRREARAMQMEGDGDLMEGQS